MTGHIALNLHLNKIGIVDFNLCSMCNLEEESVGIILLNALFFTIFDKNTSTLTIQLWKTLLKTIQLKIH